MRFIAPFFFLKSFLTLCFRPALPVLLCKSKTEVVEARLVACTQPAYIL